MLQKKPRMDPITLFVTEEGLWESLDHEEPLDLDKLRILIEKHAAQNNYRIKDINNERFEDGIASLLIKLARKLYREHPSEELKLLAKLRSPEY